MRPVERGPWPLDDHGKPKQFKSYDKFRADLIDRMGQYCSYCNQKLPASLAVEHVQPKALVPALKLNWDNFLLGCTNCNSTKTDKPVNLTDFVWPDIHNTYLAFIYSADGKVKVNPALNSDVRKKAQNMLDLVGLQKYPDEPTASDRRWKNRRDTFGKAFITLSLYRSAKQKGAGDEALALIKFLVNENGFFSIWMQVFEAHPEVKNEIISAFPGTAISAFDHHFHPVMRTAEL